MPSTLGWDLPLVGKLMPDARRWRVRRGRASLRAVLSSAIRMLLPHFIYVLALLFSPDGARVVLVRKTRPAWQAGRINALGGKLAPGETPAEAARREVREEAGVEIGVWEEFLVWEDPVYRMHALRAFDAAALEARTAEDQEVFVADVDRLPPNLIENLRWLIPLALDRDVAVPVRVRSASAAGSGLTEPPSH